MHFQTAVHNFGLQEYMRHPEQATEVFDVGYWLEDGMLHLDERPGLGVDFDEERAAEPIRTDGPTCPSPAAATAACTAGERA